MRTGMELQAMQLAIQPREVTWWFWAVTLVLIIAAVLGWKPAYAAVMVLSAAQVVFFLAQEGSVSAFPTQIRLVYFLFTLFGLWPAGRLIVYLLLLVGTFMVVFFGRCTIALVLGRMPWNSGREARLN